MYKKLLKTSILFSSFISRFIYSSPLKADQIKNIDSILFGLYEKGYKLGTQFKLNENSTLLLSISHLDIHVGNYDVGLSKKIPFDLSNRGFQIEYSKYLNNDINKTGNFINFALEISKLNTRTSIKLSELKFDFNSLVVTCRTCDNYIFESRDDLIFTPKISVGRQSKLNKRLYLNTSIGVQYLALPEVNGMYNSYSQLPFYIREELFEVKSNINKNIQNLPRFYPSASINFVYKI
tara:strand:- start:148 stop:855 length:708 start_codon:yes stop_codon:yes gene_type:complete